jgi:uncharacterized protein (DUF58 family)
VSVVCGLLLFAMVTQNGELLILAIPILVYIIAGFLQIPEEITLRVQRTMDRSGAYSQQPVKMRIMIENEGKALVNLRLLDSLSPLMTILEGNASQRLALSGGESAELSYMFSAERGLYSWNAIHACANDPFGLFDLECTVLAPGELLVRPTPMQLRPISLKPRYTIRTAGPTAARLAGSGTDYWGIREYQAGDSLRRINWRLAARHPRELFTNEYEREEIADYGLILDARRLSASGTVEEGLFEASVSAVAALSNNFIRHGNRVSLLAFGESIVPVFPGYGKKHLNGIQRNIARARLGAYLPFRYFEGVISHLIPPRSQIVVCSAVDSRDLETYARLLSFGFEVLLISPDPVDYAARLLPETKINSLASRAARVERVVILNRLLKMGVQVVDWQVNKPLDKAIHLAMLGFDQRRNRKVRQ